MYIVSVAFRATLVSLVASEQQQGRCFISSMAQLPQRAQGLPSALPPPELPAALAEVLWCL